MNIYSLFVLFTSFISTAAFALGNKPEDPRVLNFLNCTALNGVSIESVGKPRGTFYSEINVNTRWGFSEREAVAQLAFLSIDSEYQWYNARIIVVMRKARFADAESYDLQLKLDPNVMEVQEAKGLLVGVRGYAQIPVSCKIQITE